MSDHSSSTARRSSRLLIWTVFKREFAHYLQSPGTYVALSFFLLLSGASFISIIGDFAEASAMAREGTLLGRNPFPINITDRVIVMLFKLLNFLLLLVVPMLTMRLLAEEKKNGSFELLVSTPLENLDILLGKYFAALAIGCILLFLCGLYPLICTFYAAPEMSVILSGYLGLFCVVAAYTAFGLFASALTESQIAAGVLAFAGLLLLHLVDELFKTGGAGVVASALSLSHHAENFAEGIISLGDLTYYLLFVVFTLFVTVQIMDARRWRA